jgi:hypothetical protein
MYNYDNYRIPCHNCSHKSGIHFRDQCLKVKHCHCVGFQADNLKYLEQKLEKKEK